MRLWGMRSLQISDQNLLPDDDAATLEDVGIIGGVYTVRVRRAPSPHPLLELSSVGQGLTIRIAPTQPNQIQAGITALSPWPPSQRDQSPRTMPSLVAHLASSAAVAARVPCVQGVPEQLPKVTLYYDTNTLDSLTDCPVLNDTPYEYVPKFLPSTFEARPTTAGKNARAAAATGSASPSAPGTPTDQKGGGGGLLKRLGTNAKANTTSASSAPRAGSPKSGGIASTKTFTKRPGETVVVQ
jgi:hypothetical protein